MEFCRRSIRDFTFSAWLPKGIFIKDRRHAGLSWNGIILFADSRSIINTRLSIIFYYIQGLPFVTFLVFLLSTDPDIKDISTISYVYSSSR